MYQICNKREPDLMLLQQKKGIMVLLQKNTKKSAFVGFGLKKIAWKFCERTIFFIKLAKHNKTSFLSSLFLFLKLFG